jgi:2-methylcitrate dehydratase PrpD
MVAMDGTDVLEQLADASLPPLTSVHRERLTLLLADALACVAAGTAITPSNVFDADGVAGQVAAIALGMSAHDLDDVDWRSLHHPGSVIWPVSLGLGRSLRSHPHQIAESARRGYATSASVADLLGPTHRRTWHITATAGALGATTAASVLLGLTPRDHARALTFAAANVGGLALAAKQRLGAARFNRAAAATLGLLAARTAATGIQQVTDPMTEPGGVLDAMSGGGTFAIRDGMLDASPRIFPACGFLQAGLGTIAAARQSADPSFDHMTIRVPFGTATLITPPTPSPWWDGPLNLVRAWFHRDPFALTAPCPVDSATTNVLVEEAELPPGCAEIIITSGGISESLGLSTPPTFASDSIHALLNNKWANVLGVDPASIVADAQHLLQAEGGVTDLGDIYFR